jgi:hypothetical protein
VDGTRIRPLPALGAAILALTLLSGCNALEGFLAPAAVTDHDVFTISVGDCLDDADVGAEVVTVPIVDCSEPHDSEVFARTEVAGDTFPGADELEARLTEFCQGEAFTDFLGVPYVESEYYTGGYYPTASSWASGDRELLCTVRDEGARTTGSLEGAEAAED